MKKSLSCMLLASLLLLSACTSSQPPSAPSALASQPSTPMLIVSSWTTKVDPNFSVFMVRVNWDQIETVENVYNWATLTGLMAPFTSQGKQVAIIVSLAADSGVNTATPAYVLKQTPTVECKTFPDPCPVTDTPFFQSREEALIAALLAHLEPTASQIAYVRVGPVHGGESCPSCYTHQAWPGGETAFMNYLQNLADYVAALKSPIKVVYDMNGCINNAWASQMGDIAAGKGLGIGMDSASGADVAAYNSGKQCASNWCAEFKKWPNVYHYLQLYGPDTFPDLLTIVPFARSMGTNAFEIPENMLDAACDTKNPNYKQYGAQLQNVLQISCKV
jgi:hypothetical protein